MLSVGGMIVIIESPGVGVTKPISSVPLFSDFFSIIEAHVIY